MYGAKGREIYENPKQCKLTKLELFQIRRSCRNKKRQMPWKI